MTAFPIPDFLWLARTRQSVLAANFPLLGHNLDRSYSLVQLKLRSTIQSLECGTIAYESSLVSGIIASGVRGLRAAPYAVSLSGTR